MTGPPRGSGQPLPGPARSEIAISKSANFPFPEPAPGSNAPSRDFASAELRLALQRQAVEAAARFFSREQTGPRPGSREGNYIVPLLFAAACTLRRLEEAAS
jgi:hypothetical protein